MQVLPLHECIHGLHQHAGRRCQERIEPSAAEHHGKPCRTDAGSQNPDALRRRVRFLLNGLQRVPGPLPVQFAGLHFSGNLIDLIDAGEIGLTPVHAKYRCLDGTVLALKADKHAARDSKALDFPEPEGFPHAAG